MGSRSLYPCWARRARLQDATALSTTVAVQTPRLHGAGGMQLAGSCGLQMSDRMGKTGFLLALYVVALLATPAVALAGGRRHLPPDVDLDPDRSMPFDRYPKTAFDHRQLDTMKKALASHVMDPAVDPYTSIIKPSKYEPYTGQIRNSITDALREMRHNQDLARKFSASDKSLTKSTLGPKDPMAAVMAGMPKPGRVMHNPVVDPIVALRKQQQNDQKDDSDDD